MIRPSTTSNNKSSKKYSIVAFISITTIYILALNYFTVQRLIHGSHYNIRHNDNTSKRGTSSSRHDRHHEYHHHQDDGSDGASSSSYNNNNNNNRLKLNYQCMSHSSNLRDLISTTNQVIILMPAKAAGTSLKDFAKQCNGPSYSNLLDNFINFNHEIESILSNSFQMPHVIASHVNNDDNLIHMIKNIPKSTLLVYIHREETARLQSAINEVVTNWCRRGNGHPNIIIDVPHKSFFYKEVHNKCYVTESNLITQIKNKPLEMGIGSSEVLSCHTYRTIGNVAPTMVFISYKHVNQLQEMLAEKYCPALSDTKIASNVGSNKEYEAFVGGVSSGSSSSSGGDSRNNRKESQPQSQQQPIPLSSWLKAKYNTLEWALGLNNHASCIAKTRIMEDQLFGCDSGFLRTVVTED